MYMCLHQGQMMRRLALVPNYKFATSLLLTRMYPLLPLLDQAKAHWTMYSKARKDFFIRCVVCALPKQSFLYMHLVVVKTPSTDGFYRAGTTGISI